MGARCIMSAGQVLATTTSELEPVNFLQRVSAPTKPALERQQLAKLAWLSGHLVCRYFTSLQSRTVSFCSFLEAKQLS